MIGSPAAFKIYCVRDFMTDDIFDNGEALIVTERQAESGCIVNGHGDELAGRAACRPAARTESASGAVESKIPPERLKAHAQFTFAQLCHQGLSARSGFIEVAGRQWGRWRREGGVDSGIGHLATNRGTAATESISLLRGGVASSEDSTVTF